MENKPFAITAKCIGAPRQLFTRILVVNMDSDDNMTAKYVNALWDTGANTCLMTKKVADDLGIKFEQNMENNGIGGKTISPIGYAQVALVSNGETIETLTAIVDKLPSVDYSFIIGMDFIRKGTLAISTSNFETTLSFTIPTGEHIDFVKLREKEGIDREYIPLSSGTEGKSVYSGTEVIEQILPKKFRLT